MIPSTTSVSRQCLLSGKYPSQLLEPWKQSKEKRNSLTVQKLSAILIRKSDMSEDTMHNLAPL